MEGSYLSLIYFHVNASYPCCGLILGTTNSPNTSCADSQAFPVHQGSAGMSNGLGNPVTDTRDWEYMKDAR